MQAVVMNQVFPQSRNGFVSPGVVADPVFVLCMARSGSTLLRFLLDAHPELACPPETSLPALCGQLAVVWSLIEGAPLSANRGDAPPQVPDAAIAGIRRMLDEMTGGYLARRGKKRFCDKSLGSALTADLLLRIYPEARFVCLYRHPMDMIRSGLDACPWGLNGYGFEAYAGSSPGNAVLALARYWLDHATAIATVEEQYPDQCHRLRYEDLVTGPEEVAAGLCDFLGAGPAPGITKYCFTGEREQFGPADYKIWATSAITGDSVGSGESVPVGLIPPPIVAAINELADRLDYLPIDEDWGTPGRPADPRRPGTARAPAVPVADEEPPAEATGLLEESLRRQLAAMDDRFARRWESVLADKFLVVCRTQTAGGEARWLVDLAGRAFTRDDAGVADLPSEDAGMAGPAPEGAQEPEGADPSDFEWSILGSPQAWQAILSGQVNLHVAMRRNDLRYCSGGEEDGPLTSTARVTMLADLLGLSPWQRADADAVGLTGAARGAAKVAS
jgi:protein-tyrosine sulfotransferase